MERAKLLLLHGALGAKDQFAALVPILAERYEVHTLDFEGHGEAPLGERPFRIEHFAENVLDYVEEHSIKSAHFFGYSMGGYVACTLAKSHPTLVLSVATLGTKYFWDPETAARELGFLDVEKISAKVPHFARALAGRHTAIGWEGVVSRTRDLLWTLGEQGGLRPDDVSELEQRVRIIVGDRDSTVGVAECAEMYRALPRGELEVLPGTRHEIDRVSPERLAYSLMEFFG
jgi:pimeloyl-ACP methyl ester carboxylesterase